MQQGPAPRPLPERAGRAADLAAAAHDLTATSRRSTGTPRSREIAARLDGRPRRPRRRDDLLLRRRRAGKPPRRRLLRRRPWPPRRPLPLQRAGPGEDRRVLGQRPDARALDAAATSSTARSRCSSGKNPWMSPELPAGTQPSSRRSPRIPNRSMIVVDPVAPRPPSWPISTCRCGRAPTPVPDRRAGRGPGAGRSCRPRRGSRSTPTVSVPSQSVLAGVRHCSVLRASPASTRPWCARPPR